MKFKDGNIIDDGVSKIETYRKAVTLLYDSALPIPKPIGFYLDDNNGPPKKQLDRNQSVMENMISLSTTLSKLVFIPFKSMSKRNDKSFSIVTLNARRDSKIVSGTAEFMCQQSKVMTISKDLPVLTSINNVTLNMFVVDTVGYLSMEESSKLMEESLAIMEKDHTAYFPMNVDFTLGDYVKVLPPVGPGKHVEYRLFNGMTDLILNMLVERGAAYNAKI